MWSQVCINGVFYSSFNWPKRQRLGVFGPEQDGDILGKGWLSSREIMIRAKGGGENLGNRDKMDGQAQTKSDT